MDRTPSAEPASESTSKPTSKPASEPTSEPASTSASGSTLTPPSSQNDVSAAVRHARAALAAREPWKARDTLVDRVDTADDPAALDLLGEVLTGMGDLPAAGAAWFGTTRKGHDVDVAIAAWRDRYGDDFGDMWRSLPRSVRATPRSAKVEALRTKAKEADRRREAAAATDPAALEEAREAEEQAAAGGFDAAQFIAWLLAALFVVCAIIGLVQVLQWIVPG